MGSSVAGVGAHGFCGYVASGVETILVANAWLRPWMRLTVGPASSRMTLTPALASVHAISAPEMPLPTIATSQSNSPSACMCLCPSGYLCVFRLLRSDCWRICPCAVNLAGCPGWGVHGLPGLQLGVNRGVIFDGFTLEL